MYDYQISVAIGGRFFFRTDVMNDKAHVRRVLAQFMTHPDWEISIKRLPVCFDRFELDGKTDGGSLGQIEKALS